jgi:chromosome segregation ATPase
LLAFLIVGTVLSATEDETLQMIHKIDATKFGRTLFDMIYMQLEAGDPLEKLISTLHDLEDRYIAEQKEDDAANREFQDACNADIAAFDKDLAECDRDKIAYEGKLEGDLYPRRSIMTGVVNSKTKEVADYQRQIDELDAVRAEEAAEFEQKVREHEEATAIITEARRLFESLIAEEAFLQKKTTGQKLNPQGMQLIQKHMQEGLRRVHKFQHRKSYSSIFKIFMSITSRAQQLADQGHIGRIIDLCNELLAKIEDSLDLERFAEDKRIEAYKASRRLLTLSQNAAKTDLANAQVELNSINDQITQTETSLQNTNQRIENKSGEREDRWTQCEEAAHAYMEARAARDADRQTVSDTIGLVNASLRTLREQLALRLQAGDEI